MKRFKKNDVVIYHHKWHWDNYASDGDWGIFIIHGDAPYGDYYIYGKGMENKSHYGIAMRKELFKIGRL